MNYLNFKKYSIILIIIAFESFAAIAQPDMVVNFNDSLDSDVVYINPDYPTEKYTVAKITRPQLGKNWIEMFIEKDMDLKFSWRKNGGKNTDLLFYLKSDAKSDFQEITSCKGYEGCIDENWTKKTYSVKKGNIVRWGFWIRSSDLKEGEAFIAVCSKDKVPENMNPSKPHLNISSANIIVGEPLCISITSYDQDDEQIRYSFDWDGRIEEGDFILSGNAVDACHSWSAPGTYAVRAKVTDLRGKPSDWSDILSVNVSELSGLRLSTPMVAGPSVAIIGDESKYSVRGIEDLEGIRYQFEWDGEFEELQSSIDGFRHTWQTSGEKTVRARIIDNQDRMSNWSLPTKTVVYEMREVRSSDPLTNIINHSANFTKFIFMDENYQINSEIKIINKSYIIFESNSENCVLRAQSTLERIFLIRNSDNITIKNFKCGNAKTTIRICDSNNCIVEGCVLDFGNCMYGIRLISANNTSIVNNVLEYDGASCGDKSKAIAIYINNCKDSLILNNEINSNGSNLPFSYCVLAEEDIFYNTTVRRPTNSIRRIYLINYNNCNAEWYYNDGIQSDACENLRNRGRQGELIF